MTEPDWPALNVSAYVLAGGRSSRMGQDKALLEVEGEPLVACALRTLQSVCAEVCILSGPPNPERDELLSRYGRLVPDVDVTHAGPLGALTAALQDCRSAYVLLLAVDQPSMPAETLQHLVWTGTTTRAAAACFEQEGRAEPLPLFVAKTLQLAIMEAFRAGERRLLTTVETCAAESGSTLFQIRPPAPEHQAKPDRWTI